MNNYSVLESGFNSSDETINFGARNVADGANLYEATTTAFYRYSDEVKNAKFIIRNGRLFFAVNKTFRIFEDTNCTTLAFNATFDHNIATFCVTDDGKFALVCLVDGSCTCIYNETNVIVYTGSFTDFVEGESVLFIDVFLEEGLSFLIVLSNGKIYRVSQIEDTLSSALTEPFDFKFESTILINLNNCINRATFSNGSLFLSGDGVHVYDIEEDDLISSNTCNLSRIHPYGRHRFLALESSGRLLTFCAKTLLFNRIECEYLYDDFVLLCNEEKDLFYGLTTKDEPGNQLLHLMTFSDRTSVFTLKVSNARLIIPDNVNDECMYVTQLKQNNEFRFHTVSETLAEKRLVRLLRRRKFKEAEELAILYHLEVEQINKAKAEVIINKLVCNLEDVEQLFDILNNIEDEQFKLEACVNVNTSCDCLEGVRRILNYGCNLTTKNEQVTSKSVQDLHAEMCILMYRFETFLCLHDDNHVEKWTCFSTCNLIDECLSKLKYRNLEESIIIYNRLDNETLLCLNEENVEEILNELDDMSTSENILAFLYTFVPITLKQLPSTLPIFADWVRRQVLAYEKTSVDFPTDAIDFMGKIFALIKVKYLETSIRNGELLEELLQLFEALKTQQLLNQQYNINLALSDCLQPAQLLIKTLLNIALPGADYQRFLKEYLMDFIVANRFNPDEIFLKEINDMVKYQESYWSKIVQSMLDCINSINCKLEAIYAILKAAEVPWSDPIRDISKLALNYDNPIVEMIKNEIENEPKCVILKKECYKLSKMTINSIERHQFAVSRIIYCNQPEMIEDIYGLCKDSEERHEATLLLLRHFIENGKYTEALNILDNAEDSRKCLARLMFECPFVISNQYNIKNLPDHYYNILGALHKRWQTELNTFETKYYNEEVTNVTIIYKLRKCFSTRINLEQLRNSTERKRVFDELLDKQVGELKSDTLNVQECFRNCENLAAIFNRNKNEVMLEFCEKLENLTFLLNAIRNFFNSETDAKVACSLAVLLLKTIELFPAEWLKEETETNMRVEVLNLTAQTVLNSVVNAPIEDVEFCMEVTNWIYSFYFLMPKKIMLTTSVYSNENTSIGSITSSSVAISRLWNLFTRFKCSAPLRKSLHLQNGESLTTLTDRQIVDGIQSISQTINNLIAEGQIFTAYKLIVTFEKQFTLIENLDGAPKMRTFLTETLKQCSKFLLKRLFACKLIDTNSAFNLLLSFDKELINSLMYDNLKLYKRNAYKFKTIAQLYLQLIDHHRMNERKQLCINIILMCKWWGKIDNCQIPYDEFFNLKPITLLKKLIDCGHFSIELLQEFTLNFDLNIQDYYLLYLNKLLVNWKPDYDLNDANKLVKNTEFELYDKCIEVIELIDGKETVYELIQQLKNAINFYHYEVFLCLLKMEKFLEKSEDAQQNCLLIFLKNYKRVSRPGQMEIEQWYTAFPYATTIDDLSQWRLPFTTTLFTKDLWNIIRPELNLKTYEIWFIGISILPKILNKDDICSYVVKDVVSSGHLGDIEKNAWDLHPRHDDLFDKIDKCVQNISNLELATSVVYYLSTHTPTGIDQVNAIKLCYKYALKYKEENEQVEDVLKAFTKIERKLYSFSITHILHKYQLTDKKYIDAIAAPLDELVDLLYMDERILLKADSVFAVCPDINSAVNELALLYNTEISTKRCNLLKSWLISDAHLLPFDFDISTSKQRQTLNLNKDNFTRAVYMCSGDPSFWRNYLLKITDLNLNESHLVGPKRLNYKARALDCFRCISDENTIELLVHSTYDEFKKYINKLVILGDLEHFGISLSLDTLDNCNKSEILQRLLPHVMNGSCAKLMALLYITYNIEHLNYCEAIVDTMSSLQMVEELQNYLVFLREQPSLHYKKYYIKGWKVLINYTFNHLDRIPKHSIRDALAEKIHFLQSCPVLYSLNLERVATQLLQLQLYDFAVVILPYVDEDKKLICAKEILRNDANIIDKVKDLKFYGFCGIAMMVAYLESVVLD